MKRTLLATLLVHFLIIATHAQILHPPHKGRTCGTVKMMEEARRNNPNAETEQQFEAWLQAKMQHMIQNARTNVVYTLPVVFHVIHNGEAVGSGFNISQDRIHSQLNQINRDFSNNSGSAYANAADTEIRFCLAQNNPTGTALSTPGIDRISRVARGWTDPGTTGWDMNYINNVIKPATIWDPYRYLNIWILPLGEDLGFATFPVSSTLPGLTTGETDQNAGVVVTTSSVGSIVTPAAACGGDPYIMGRTLSHELGHFFGLRHIWGDSNCGNDYVDDTPIHQTANYGSPTHPKANSCGTADEMFENFMDYSDDAILNTFTVGQVMRMQIVMLNSPRRKELPTSNAGLVGVVNNRMSFTACATSTVVSEKGTSPSFPWYREIPVLLSVEGEATGAATVNIVTGGTAVNGSDYQIINPSITFAAGESSKKIIVRILDDAIPEPTKTIQISYSISGSGVTAATTNQTYTITIIDDDLVRPGESAITLLTENFETFGANIPAGWSSLASANPANVFVVSSNGNAGGTGQAAHITNNPTTKPNTYTKTSSVFAVLRTPVINTAGLTNVKFQYKYRVAGEYYGGSNYFDYGYAAWAPSSAGTNFSSVPGATILASTSATPVAGTQNITLPASFNNTSFYLGIAWNNDNADGNDPGLNIDDVLITADGTRIETVTNSTHTFAVPTGTVNNFKSRQFDRLMATVSNVSANIPQLTVTIVEGGNDRPTITTTTGTYFRSRKVFQVSPPTADHSTSYTVTFYFTPNEMAAWGASANNLKILKVNNTTDLSSTLSSSDGVIVTPTTVDNKLTTDGYIAYTATFTGFSKFMLVEENALLPVRLLGFDGEIVGTKARLTWKTTAEANNKGFEVERSINGADFTNIGFVAAQGGPTINTYHFDDHEIQSGTKYYYRLKQIDIDGRYVYSHVINLAYMSKDNFTWYPNPVKDKLVIQNNSFPKNAMIVVTDMAGRVMYSSQSLVSGKLQIATNNWAPGVYSVRMTVEGEPVTFKIVKD